MVSKDTRDFVNVTVVLAREQDLAIRQLRLSEHTSASDIVRRAIASYLRTYHPELAAHSRAPGLSESRTALPQP